MPGTRCSVFLCNNSQVKTKLMESKEKITYHGFPKDPGLRKQWITVCRKPKNWNADNARVCSIHFEITDFKRNLQAELLGTTCKMLLKENAVPSINLGKTEDSPETASRRQARQSRIEIRERKKVVGQILLDSCTSNVDSNELPNEPTDTTPLSVEITPHSISAALEIQTLLNEKEKLQKTIENQKLDMAVLRNRLKYVTEQEERKKLYFSNLKKELSVLKKRQVKESAMREKYESCLKAVFTESQIKVLIDKRKKVSWDEESITRAYAIRKLSKRAYIFIRKTMGIPLPGLSTLRGWTAMNAKAINNTQPVSESETTGTVLEDVNTDNIIHPSALLHVVYEK